MPLTLQQRLKNIGLTTAHFELSLINGQQYCMPVKSDAASPQETLRLTQAPPIERTCPEAALTPARV
jgi:hypothetical protein